MPRVTEHTVAHVARLARLTLRPDERATFARQLDAVLAHAESLQALDLAAVEAPELAAPGALRDDEPRPGLPAEQALGAAPDAADRLFRVPRVLPG
jgi:aspartyl-tRNA(Asn)/glutamyl-tRNA(Gln) amidotransferase subunit C